MANSNLVADPAQIQSTGKTMMGLQGNLEGYLKSLLAVQSDLESHLKSPAAGMRVQDAMTNAYTKGSSLVQKLADILQILQESGVKIDVSDMDNASKVQHATAFGEGHAGTVNQVAGNDIGGKVHVDWALK